MPLEVGVRTSSRCPQLSESDLRQAIGGGEQGGRDSAAKFERNNIGGEKINEFYVD